MTCLVVANTTNPFFRPVPLLSAVVDSDRKQVLKVYDRLGSVPVHVPPANDYDDETLARELSPLPQVSPFLLSQPLGPSFQVHGNTVSWQSWRFHLKPHARAGLVVSQAAFQDPHTKVYRSVLYQLHPSEMFVPYQSPDLDSANRDYADVGEYGFGVLGTTMGVPSDCPPHSVFFNATLVSAAGQVVVVDRAVCLFERPSSVSAWRHVEEFGTPFANGRTQVELVARMVTTVGNYDYFVDVTFKQDGSINVAISATGILEIEACAHTRVDPNNRFRDNPYGTMMSPFHIGTFHDHLVNFRVDLDPDGTENRFVREQLQRERLPPDNAVGRKSIWRVQEKVMTAPCACACTHVRVCQWFIDVVHVCVEKVVTARVHACVSAVY